MRSVLVLAIIRGRLDSGADRQERCRVRPPRRPCAPARPAHSRWPGPVPRRDSRPRRRIRRRQQEHELPPALRAVSQRRLRLVQHRLPHGARVPFPARPRTIWRAPSAGSKPTPAKYHVDASKIAIIGESAGGFLVNYAGTHETPETKVAAVVDFYGPVDYAKLALERRDHPERFNMKSISAHFANGGSSRFFGAEQLDEAGLAKLHDISPLFAVHKGMPPFLCIHGTKDDQVSYDQSPAFCDAMHKVGVAVRANHYRRRRPRHEWLEGAGDAALEARDDRVAGEDAEGALKARLV